MACHRKTDEVSFQNKGEQGNNTKYKKPGNGSMEWIQIRIQVPWFPITFLVIIPACPEENLNYSFLINFIIKKVERTNISKN